MEWNGQFVQPSSTDFPRPYYINRFSVGITVGTVEWSLVRGKISVV